MMAIRWPARGKPAAIAGAALIAGCTALQPTPQPPQPSPPEVVGPDRLLPVSPPPLQPPSAGWLEGLTPAEVQRRLGPADFVRMEPGAHLMQYRGASCSLDIVFGMDGPQTATLTAGYLAARSPNGAAMGVDRCLAELVPPARWPPAP